MNAQERLAVYRKQAGVPGDKPYVSTPKQRRRINQKLRRGLKGA